MRRPSLFLFAVLASAGILAATKLAAPDRAASKAARHRVVQRPARNVSRTTFTFAATGDIAMVASSESPYYFTGVSRYLTGDVVMGNLEGTLTDRGDSKCGSGSSSCFAFRAPPSYGRLLRAAGFTVMNLANNHAYDFGAVGQADTVATLDRLGLRHTGRPGEIAILRAHGLRIALLGFAPYPWAQSLTNIRAAQRLVRRADAMADVVVVTMHAGGEGADHTHVTPSTEYFLGENRGDSVEFTHAVVDAGADLVVGSGPHVLRGMEWYRGRLIAYSLGNFEGAHTLSTSGILAVSGILRVKLRGDGSWVHGDLVPVRLVGSGIPERDPAEEAHGVVRSLSREDFGRRGMRVSYTGVLLPPR